MKASVICPSNSHLKQSIPWVSEVSKTFVEIFFMVVNRPGPYSWVIPQALCQCKYIYHSPAPGGGCIDAKGYSRYMDMADQGLKLRNLRDKHTNRHTALWTAWTIWAQLSISKAALSFTLRLTDFSLWACHRKKKLHHFILWKAWELCGYVQYSLLGQQPWAYLLPLFCLTWNSPPFPLLSPSTFPPKIQAPPTKAVFHND